MIAEASVRRRSVLYRHGVFGSGQKAKYSLRAHKVRFAPEGGLKSDIAPCPVGAMNGLMQRSKLHFLLDQLVGSAA